MIHIANEHPKYGRMPLCGRDAPRSDLTNFGDESTCWECRSIAGVPTDMTYLEEHDPEAAMVIQELAHRV